MLIRVGLAAALFATAPLGRGCTPDTTTSSEAEAPSGAASVAAVVVEEAEPQTPAPPPRLSFTPDELAPLPPTEPLGAAGAAVRAAITALEEERLEDAVRLATVDAAGPVADLAAWTRARALRALDRDADALSALQTISPDSRYGAEASLAIAELTLAGGDAAATLELLGPYDPDAEVMATTWRRELLRARALRARGGDGDLAAAAEAAKRVWRHNPGSQADADAEVLLDAVEPQLPEEARRGLADSVARARAWGTRHGKKSIVTLLDDEQDALVALGATDPATACTGLFELGRAWHKQRKYSESVPVLQKADALCAGDEEVKTIYLLAQGQARKGDVSAGITTFLRLPDEHPEHSYADDGLWQASRLALDEGRNEEAATHAQRLVDAFPDGDMRGSTLWNLAWSALSDGRPADALPWLEAMAAADAYGPDREHALQGQYWQARVLLRSAPGQRDEALTSLESLAVEHPLHWYGALAGWLLLQEDADRAAAVERTVMDRAIALRTAPREPEAYQPLRVWVERPGVQAAMQLLRAGLGEEAAEELARDVGFKPHQECPDPATLLFAAHLYEVAGDPARSHNLLRMACRDSFPQADVTEAMTLTHAWPRAFGEVIDSHTGDYAWDSLLFQGLVREESAFNAEIVSWAGAIGLSQLMWPTAKETARRMGIRVRRADLNDPSTNVHIGTTYFEGLAQRWRGHLPLAVASYNAGPGAVKRWVDARGHLDLDAWVETIPYDQTRHYVKRVVSSWQAYRLLYGEGQGWVPLRVGPVAEAITGKDPTPPSAGG